MPAITPATLPQIQQMKEAIKHAKSYRIYLDDTVTIDSTTSYIIFDDSNQILHAIDANTAVESQFTAPMRIRSISYDRIEFFSYET